MEQVIASVITQDDIIDAMAKMQERGEFPNTISLNPNQFCKLKQLPGYSEDFLYGCQVVNYEMGAIEGLIVQVIPGVSDKGIYLSIKPLGEKFKMKWV